MSVIESLILGIVQGLTEFLPVSSSGHLVLFQQMFGLTEPQLMFDVAVHAGTLGAVLIFYRAAVLDMIRAVTESLRDVLTKKIGIRRALENPDARMAAWILAGSVPTVIIGLLFKTIADRIFSSVFLVGCALIITGILLWATRRVAASTPGENETGHMSLLRSLLIGTVQGLAVLPGISRSGATIAAGLFCGLNRNEAVRFSFLLSIPAITGAAGLTFFDSLKEGTLPSMEILVIGLLTALIVGYLSLRFLVFVVHKGKLYIFSPYCLVLGLAAIYFGIH